MSTVALLWEIHRLRAVALRADQLVRSLPGPSVGSLGFIADALRDQLRTSRVVLEQRGATEALLAKTQR